MGKAGDFDQATATMARDTPAVPLAVVVRVTGVEPAPDPYRLEIGRCTVGSGATADLVIPASTVSRNHVELSVVPEGVLVRDLGSRNGTFYLGQRIEKMVLGLGGQLNVGQATLSIEADKNSLLDQLRYDGDSYRGIVGVSTQMKRLFAMLTRLEGSLATVLVEGESGVGKEVVAQALHQGSPVSGGPNVVVNCGAISHELVASELFGHVRGSFTGAVDDRIGAFAAAHQGTLFLDEVGELPLDVQPMLLRALESREVRPVGSRNNVPVQVRVVAATNRDLQAEVREGRFREDLYYRLAVVNLQIPPLRERIEDVEPLIQVFAQQYELDDLPAHIVEQLKARQWPGNARELRNAIQVFAALGALPEVSRSKKATLDLALGEAVDLSVNYATQKERILDEFTLHYLRELLAHTKGNQTLAAEIAGLDRSYLGRLLVKHGLKKK